MVYTTTQRLTVNRGDTRVRWYALSQVIDGRRLNLPVQFDELEF